LFYSKKMFVIKSRSSRKNDQMHTVFGPEFFGTDNPKFLQ